MPQITQNDAPSQFRVSIFAMKSFQLCGRNDPALKLCNDCVPQITCFFDLFRVAENRTQEKIPIDRQQIKQHGTCGMCACGEFSE